MFIIPKQTRVLNINTKSKRIGTLGSRGLKDKKSFSFFRKLRPSLRLLEKVIGRETSSITTIVDSCISSATRYTAQFRNPVSKAQCFTADDLLKMYDTCMEPIFNKQPAKPEFLRALLRAYTVYYGFLRFTDYCSIADENVQDMGTFIKIYIPKSKNDQVRIVTLF